MNQYCRQDVLRIFQIREQQLRLWERNGLIACGESYSFQDLGHLRKLRELGEQRISAASIRDSIHAMRLVSGMADPLGEAAVSSDGSRVVFRHSGSVMEPIARQFLLDFEGEGRKAFAPVHASIEAPPRSGYQRELYLARIFSDAVHAEELGRHEDAMRGYEEMLAVQPGHAAACINLGTLFYNQRDYGRAEQLYRMATESDSSYALAFFDLGNVLDELKRMPEAIAAYQRAVALTPAYADAHYNLALALERSGERRRALRHWEQYLRLDREGPWADHARLQMRKTLAREPLKLVPLEEAPSSSGPWEEKRRAGGDRPALHLV